MRILIKIQQGRKCCLLCFIDCQVKPQWGKPDNIIFSLLSFHQADEKNKVSRFHYYGFILQEIKRGEVFSSLVYFHQILFELFALNILIPWLQAL